MLGENKNKERKFIHINHSAEILLWLVIIAVFVSMTSVGKIFKEKNDENDYQIFLQDVDGLIVGSPVRMMGIQVGHVVKIKPVKDEVYVKFILTDSEAYIPQGTSVTVEFSGMAGSKSLELYPPQNGKSIDKSAPVININPPKRLHDAFGLLNDMFKKLDSIIYATSDFGRKLKNEEMDSLDFMKSSKGMNDFLRYSDEFLDESTQKAADIRKSIEGLKKNAK